MMDYVRYLCDLCDFLSERTGIEFLFDDTENVGFGRTYVDRYTMMPDRVVLGVKACEGLSDDGCLVAGVIAAYHEYRHLLQLDALLNLDVGLSGVSNDDMAVIATSYVTYNGRPNYSDRYYVNLPHEIDAERYGTVYGLSYCDNLIGKKRTISAFRERCRFIEQSSYPANLLLARMLPSEKFAEVAFDGHFRAALMFGMKDVFLSQAQLNCKENNLSLFLLERVIALQNFDFQLMNDNGVNDINFAKNDLGDNKSFYV